MSADPHWENLKEIFLAAVALAPDERRTYLDRACDGDTSLQVAVESLLKSHEKTGFIDEPAYRAAAEMLVKGAELESGQTVAHYKILSLLGEGGMGKVYLAQDTKLHRKVALKFLPPQLAGNHDHMRRFVQEAKSAAGLHHPNIAQIFEIGDYETTHYIAMEHVEGETLRQLLARRKLEITKAVEFAAQVASGLATAHKEGIIHRDIKPENLVVTTTGQIKILDFGLAKLVQKEVGGVGVSELTTAYIQSGNATTPGVILGTVSYMSPEQARAEKLDQRTDIFSLGGVLYEMITGERPFRGKSAIDTLHAITSQEPVPVTQLSSQLPPELAEVLSKALAKETSERYQHAGDFELDLRRFKRALESNTLISTQTQHRGMPRTGKWGLSVPLLLVGAFIVFGVAAIAWLLGRSSVAPKNSTLALASVTLTPLTTDPGYEGEPTFSADGETIAYVSDRNGNFEIYLKQISGGPDINITNNAADDVQPAFSPDGKQIAFVSTRSSSSNLLYPGRDRPLLGGDIWVMPALGGSARRIVESGNFPSWSADGKTIIFTSGTSQFQPKLRRVDAQGGPPQDISVKFKADESLAAFWFYSSYSADMRWISFEADGNIFVVSSEGGEARRIVKGHRPTWGANSQAIIYSNDEPGKNNSLWQIPFSTTDGTASGAPEPLTVGRGRDTQAAISRDGKLIAFAAQDLSFNIETLPFDAELGRQTGPLQEVTRGSNNIEFLSFSPDRRSIVFQSHRGASSHIWRVDVGSAPVQLTSDANFNDSTPRWSPDGQSIAFVRRPVGVPDAPGVPGNLWLMSADGAKPRLLTETAVNPQWGPSGLTLVYGSVAEGRQNQLFMFDLATNTSRRLTNEPAVVPLSTFSPDGKWLIYQSNQSGNVDLRAVPISGGASRIVVATPHGDYHPFVSPSGKWLYFQLDHKNIYRVPGPAQEWRRAEPEKVTNFPESGLFLEDPQISRDGHWLLYSHGRITGDVWIMNLGK
jgi:serine/threonine protein kinase